jgi:hypothetical protein
MTDQPESPMAGLSLDRVIHIRWVLRDIKGNRTKLSPVSPADLMTLVEMGLVEMRDEIPRAHQQRSLRDLVTSEKLG